MPRETKRIQKTLGVKGFGLVLPNDRLPDDVLQIARNIRIFREGEVRIRPGFTKLNPIAMPTTPTHSLLQLNDPLAIATQSYAIVAGSGNQVYTDDPTHTIFSPLQESAVDLLFSGSPLTYCIARPFQSPDPWCYIGDSLRTRKLRVDRTNYPWGTASPILAPTLDLSTPIYKVISDFENTTESAVAWTNTGTAGAITAVNRLAALGITYLQYDSGSTGWASVVPASFPTDLQAGMLIIMSVNPETVPPRVEEVFLQIASTTIGSIAYDNAPTNTGLCTIQPATPMPGIERDMLLRLAAAENVRVLSVTESPDGAITSFRCSTTTTRAAGNAIDGLRSFRANFSNTHSAADTISTKAFSYNVTVGTGNISHLVARDLSNTNSRPLRDDDEIHISLQIDDTTNLQEMRLFFDIDPTTHDYQHNALFKVFRASDFSAAIAGSQTIITAQRTALSRYIVENSVRLRKYSMFDGSLGDRYNPDVADIAYDTSNMGSGGRDNTPYVPEPIDSGQVGLGTSQWSELRFKVKDLERIGTDLSRGLKDVAAIRIQVSALATIAVKVDAWWIGGTYGPESASEDLQTLPYYYAYRYRSSTTGTKSNFSPPTRSGVMPRRNAVIITPVYSTDPQINLIDYVRYGGSLAEWQLLGTTPNSGTFTDIFPDSSLLGKTPVNLTDDFQPFPTIDTPKAGTCDVKGTTVIKLTGDNFNTAWSRNSEIFIDGIRYTIYTNPSSATTLELNENCGTKTSVNFFIPEATILGQPLPSIWGPTGTAIFGGVIFACGDTYQPGVLFYTNPGNPDSTKDINQLEISSGSEILINGCIYRRTCYVASNEKWYEIIPRFGYGYSIVDNLGAFISQDTTNTKGLFARKALAVGDRIYYRAEDGIYAYNGGEAQLISGDLYPLFPHAGISGEAISLNNFGTPTIFYPPDDTLLDKQQMECHDNLVYYTYQDTSGVMRTLVYSTLTQGWNSEDTYTPEMLTIYGVEAKSTHRLLLGGKDGAVYQSAVNHADVNTDIVGWVRTGSDSVGDARSKNHFYELWLDLDTNSSPAIAIPALDDCNTLPISTTISTISRDEALIDIRSTQVDKGKGVLARNIALDYQFSKGIIYGWEFTCADNPPGILAYEVLPTAFGLSGFTHIGTIYISYIADADWTLKIVVDNLAISYTIPSSSGLQSKYRLMPYAVKGKLHALQVISSSQMNLFVDSCEVWVGEWGRQTEYSIQTPFNDLTHRVGSGGAIT